MKLMIVDDEPMMREMLADIFGLEDNVETLCCANGSEAVEQFPSFKPDVILLDLMMPDMDGYQVCKAIKQSSLGNPRIVILSGLEGEEVREKCLNHGADDVYFKPLGVASLRLAVMP